MKLHNHVIIEKPRGKIVWYPRWFFHITEDRNQRDSSS